MRWRQTDHEEPRKSHGDKFFNQKKKHPKNLELEKYTIDEFSLQSASDFYSFEGCFFLVVKLYGFGLMRGKKLRHHKVEFSMDSIVGGSAQLLSHLFYALDPSETRCSVDSLWDRQ